MEFFVSADVGAAWEFKFPVGQSLGVCAMFLFGFIEDIVVVTFRKEGFRLEALGWDGRVVGEVSEKSGGVVGWSGVE